jgi:hypothetical protein
MSKRANRLLFGTLGAFVLVSIAALWLMASDRADRDIVLLIAGFLALGSVVGILERLERRSSRIDPNDPKGHLYKWYGSGR